MTTRNKSTLPARQRKAGAHQDGARRPVIDSGCYGTGVHCDGCQACMCRHRRVAVSCPWCEALSGEERGE
jgi:predicted NAD/FAD-binding protein